MKIPIQPMMPWHAQNELHRAADSLFRAINKRRNSLSKEIEEAYKQTGFPFPVYRGNPSASQEAMESLLAWDTLPHQYVQSKLLEIDDYKARINDAIERLALNEVRDGLNQLLEATKRTFEEVEEFLASPLARMKREEWEQHPNWLDRLYSPSSYWKIGDIPTFENRLSKRRTSMEGMSNAIYN